MKKDFEVFEIGNGIWGGKLADGNDLAGNTVYKHFYGLSEKVCVSRSENTEGIRRNEATVKQFQKCQKFV